MRIHIFFTLLAISIVIAHSKSIPFTEQDIKQRWSWLSEQLNAVSRLTLPANDLSEESYIKIFSHPMPNLTYLSFNLEAFEDYKFYETLHVRLTPKIIQTIFTSKYFQKLKSLDLTETNANDHWFQFLQNMELNSSLQGLSLKGLRLGKKGYALLSKINFGGKLKYLQLDGSLLLEDETIESLLKIICKFDENKKCSTQLQTLKIQRTDITRHGFIKLLQNLNTTTLKNLYLNSAFLHYNKTYKEGFNFTAYQKLASLSFPKLQGLRFWTCGINDEIAKIFSNWKLPQLRSLQLRENPISDKGFKLFVTKQNMPKLSTLNLHFTNLVEQSFKHLKEQEFSLTELDISQTKISPEGLEYLKKTNLNNLQKFMIAGFNMKTSIFYSFLNEVNCTKLKEINLGNLNDMGDLLIQFPWKRFKQMEIFKIFNIDIDDGVKQIIGIKSVVLPNLKMLQLIKSKITFQGLNLLVNEIPTLFPKLNRLAIKSQENYFPVSLRKVFTLPYPEGTLFDFQYIKFKKTKTKLEIIKLIVYSYLLYDNTQDDEISSISQLSDYLGLIMERIDYQNIVISVLVNQAQISHFKMITEIQKVKVLPKLTKLYFAPDLNIEDFFTLFNDISFPNLKELAVRLTLPGDIQDNFIQKKLFPFFATFQKLEKLIISLTFLNQETGPEMKRIFFNQLNYPFLTSFFAEKQDLTTSDVSTFFKRHSKTLIQINLGGNFLEQGFFQLLSQNKVLLQSLNLQGISFTATQFAKLGKVQTSFLLRAAFSKSDLSNEHLQLMIQAKSPGPYFPKLQTIFLVENNIQKQGLQALFQTGMFNLIMLINERNSNPSYLNSLLTYPNKVEAIVAESFDIYSLDKDLNPLSVSQVIFFDVQAYSFTVQDIQILGKLNFYRLQQSVINLANIYDCKALENLLKVNRQANVIGHRIQNDKVGLNSKCLANVKHQSKLIKIQIEDEYGTTYIPEYIQRLTNSTRNIDYVSLIRTRLSPSSLRTILSKRLHSAYYINLPYNYLDDETVKILLSGQLDHLRYLSLKATQITSQSVINIAAKSPKISYLDVSLNQLNTQAIQAIKTFAPTLQFLALNGCNLEGDSLRILKDITFLKLTELNLNYNKFTEEDILQFLTDIQRKNAPSLKKIFLKGVPLSIPKFKLIEKITVSKGFTNIELDRPYNIPQSNAAKY